jgi:uncharacterized membrane protein (UPF0127 family)
MQDRCLTKQNSFNTLGSNDNGDEIIVGTHSFSTLVAVSSEEQAQGLMWQKWPPPIMSFPFAKASIKKFWMKNTPSPLDIVFVKDSQIVKIESGEPFSTKCVGPNQPVDMVVEFPAGTCKSLGIDVGTVVRKKFSLKTAIRTIKDGMSFA